MDNPEQALSQVLEAAKALIRLDRTEPGIVPEIAGSPIDGSAARPFPQIGGAAFDKAACGQEVSVEKGDRIAVPLPPSPGVPRLRTAMLSGVLVAVLGFASGWFARSYIFPGGDSGSSAPGALTGKPSTNLSADSRGDIKVRTVSRELPIEGRALLDTIAGSESAYPDRDPYKAIYGGRVVESLTDHPRQYVQIVAGPNAGQKTSAAGRYQYLKRSWEEASKALKLPDFSPASQDKAAFWEAQRIHRTKTGRDLVTDIQEADGDPQKLTAIGRGISSWWTSLPGGIEPNKATASFGERFAQNLIYYRNLPQTVALDARGGGSGPKVAPVSPFSPNAGPVTPDSAGASRGWLSPWAGPGPTAPDAVGTSNLAALAPLKPRSPQQTGSTNPDQPVTRETTDRDGRNPQTKTRADRVHGWQTHGPQITNSVSLPKTQNTRSMPETKSAGGAMLSTQTTSVPETRPGTIEGWAVSDVVGGRAVLQGPDRTLNVTRGDVVPGVGKVDDILRWGNRWIVATEGGLISTP